MAPSWAKLSPPQVVADGGFGVDRGCLYLFLGLQHCKAQRMVKDVPPPAVPPIVVLNGHGSRCLYLLFFSHVCPQKKHLQNWVKEASPRVK